jgi:outer membrane protein OmpA-like peptidoglycan-associated protein
MVDNSSSIADLFSGLTIVFLFIAISMMLETERKRSDLDELANAFYGDKEYLHNLLTKEFSEDFERWNAELDDDLTIRFNNPDILFKRGSSELGDEFKYILYDFWPRYINIVGKNREKITSVAIEGHTSSYWCKTCSDEFSYFKNMELSQDRAYRVLEYCWSISEDKNVLKDLVTATGLSFSRRIFKNDVEDLDLSKRVEFSLKLNAEKIISKIKKEI